MKSKKFPLIFMLVISLSIALSVNLAFQTLPVISYKGNQPVIIFDLAHEQRFNHTHLQSAIQMLRDEFDANVYLNYDNFTLTNIRGADLLISTGPHIEAQTSSLSEIERQAIYEFYQDGGSVLYLANPYFFETQLRNYSINPTYLNNLMGKAPSGASSYGTLSFSQTSSTLMNDFNYRYNDERFIYIDNNSLLTNHPILTGYGDIDPIDELLIYSHYIAGGSSVKKIVTTPITTYEVNKDGEVPFGSTKSYDIVVAQEFTHYSSRGISCASAIMFSDLQITEYDSTTWFEVYDNALLWKNMIAWLLFDIPEEAPVNPIPDFGLFAISMISAFFLMMIVGSFLFTVGRESKKIAVSEAVIKMRERDESRKKIEKDIEAAYFADEEVTPTRRVAEEEEVAEETETKEIDMKSISEEVRKKPPKARSRSERRRTN